MEHTCLLFLEASEDSSLKIEGAFDSEGDSSIKVEGAFDFEGDSSLKFDGTVYSIGGQFLQN